MKVALGSDKSGFLLKEAIKKYLTEQGIEFEDMGTQDLEHGKPYYEAAPVVARAVQSGQFDRGILICGTGMGLSLIHISSMSSWYALRLIFTVKWRFTPSIIKNT